MLKSCRFNFNSLFSWAEAVETLRVCWSIAVRQSANIELAICCTPYTSMVVVSNPWEVTPSLGLCLLLPNYRLQQILLYGIMIYNVNIYFRYFFMRAIKSSVKDKPQSSGVRKAVSYFKGVVNLAEKLNTHQANVSKWLYKDRAIPIKYAVKIEYLTNGEITARELRPDILKKPLA
jgi:DNA-binding transcriptional regulator YdaS (Cro superfamily)